MTDLELLSRRLSTMERRFRWMTRLGIAVGTVVTTAALMAQIPERARPGEVLPDGTLRPETRPATTLVENEVRSHHFVLVDEKGKERASLVADHAGSVFW